MNSKTNDICAFPVTPTNHAGQIADTQLGMSLRDYFAAKAMQRIPFGEYETERVAKIAYETADAMLKAREDVKE